MPDTIDQVKGQNPETPSPRDLLERLRTQVKQVTDNVEVGSSVNESETQNIIPEQQISIQEQPKYAAAS